jgi:hypothetical protein
MLLDDAMKNKGPNQATACLLNLKSARVYAVAIWAVRAAN